MMDELRPFEDADLPPELTGALNELYPKLAVPSRVDDAILDRARARFAWLRRTRPVIRFASLAAAAAILLFAIGLLLNRSSTAPQVANRQDLNGDGQVDIRDALFLAQRLDRSRPEWDFNQDGRVDRADADVIAMTAVSLKGATPG